MPELTASTKIVLGSVAAAAALITGLLGNVLAANISAFFSGSPAKNGRRPTILWLAFFVSASLSVIAGSVATFSPAVPARPTATVLPTGSPAPTSVSEPKIVVTNVSASMVAQNPRVLLMVCRDTVEIANTSDIATSVVAVGTQLHIDNAVITVAPTDREATSSAGQVTAALRPWQTGPDTRAYDKLRSLDQFGSIQGQPLPIRIDARSTAAIYIDYALQLTGALPHSVTTVHVLRFPDIKDLQTPSTKCQ